MKPDARWRRALEGATALGLSAVVAIMLGLDAVLGLGAIQTVWLGVGVGTVIGGWAGSRGLQRFAAGALGLLLITGLGPGLPRLVEARVRHDSLPNTAVDAVIVLAGSISTDGRIGARAADRLLEGIRLVRHGVAPRLVVSRVVTTTAGDTVTSDGDIRYLLETAGLQAELHTLAPVGTTRLEAERYTELATGAGWRRVVVVTSPLHTRRACAAFERLGSLVTCRASPDRSLAWRHLDGADARVAGFADWLYEMLAWVQYRLRGWV